MSSPSRRPITQALTDPWLLMPVIVGVALFFRLYDLDAVTLINDEPQDLPAAIHHADRPNPFAIDEYLAIADPSQGRLPYYLTAIGLRLLSATDAMEGTTNVFYNRGGRVTVSGDRARWTMVAVVALACVLMGWAAPWPLGRLAGLLPAAGVLGVAAVTGWPEVPCNQLVAARYVAGFVGAVGVWATYGLGNSLFGRGAGLIAAATMAVSTMHIAWTRCAVTTGDGFVTTFTVLAVWGLQQTFGHRSGRGMIGAAASMGLAFAAKVSAIVLWPIAVVYPLLCRPAGDGASTGESILPERCGRLRAATALHLLLVLPLAAVFFWPVVADAGQASGPRLVIWLGVWVAYVFGVILLCRSAWLWPGGRGRTALVVVNLVVGGGVTAALATPYHLRIEAIQGMIDWWHQFGARPGQEPNHLLDLLSVVELLVLHTGLPINLLAVWGLVRGLRRAERHWGVLVWLVIVCHVAPIVLLHQKAVYYLLPLLPVLHVVAAGTLAAWVRSLWSRRRWLGIVAAAVFIVLCGRLVWTTVTAHPHYLLVGHAYAGRIPLGPKLAPANVQLQGARPVVRWLAEHAEAGARVGLLGNPEDEHRLFEKLARVILAYETARSEAIIDKGVRFHMVAEPAQAGAFEYVLLLPDAYAMAEHLVGYRQVYRATLHGVVTAKLYRRRG